MNYTHSMTALNDLMSGVAEAIRLATAPYRAEPSDESHDQERLIAETLAREARRLHVAETTRAQRPADIATRAAA